MNCGLPPLAPSAAAILARRARAIRDTWGGEGLPFASPVVTANQTGVGNARDSWPADCDHVDLLECSTLRGGVSRAHLCFPVASPALHAVRDRLVVVHGGHSDSYMAAGTRAAYLTYRLLREGYHVLGVSMPTDGFNAAQSFAKLDATPVTITAHDFSALAADGAKALRFFVDGMILAVNYALNTLGFSHADAIGISGGAWTVEMVAAVDTRIRRSASVFGSMPWELRAAMGGPGDNGDWEQLPTTADIWRVWGREEVVYAAGCIDAGRRRVQLLGPSEPVFPTATVADAVARYGAGIDAVVPTGQHEIRSSAATAHEYTDTDIEWLMDWLEAA